jgi:hypothetical protein
MNVIATPLRVVMTAALVQAATVTGGNGHEDHTESNQV